MRRWAWLIPSGLGGISLVLFFAAFDISPGWQFLPACAFLGAAVGTRRFL